MPNTNIVFLTSTWFVSIINLVFYTWSFIKTTIQVSNSQFLES